MIDIFQEKYWAIDYGFASRILPILESGKIESFLALQQAKPVMMGERAEGFYSAQKIKNTLLIGINGTMTRSGGACSLGNEHIAADLLAAQTMQGIESIVLQMNTPGGTVDSTAMLADAVKNSSKPVLVHVTGMCCSAGMYVASQAREIFVENANASILGSIGVMRGIESNKKMVEAGNAPEVTLLRGPKSGNKAKLNGYEEMTQEVFDEQMAVMAAIEDDFHAAVMAGRPNMSPKVFKDEAKTYTGAQAIKLGMADRIGSLADTIARAEKLVKRGVGGGRVG